MALVEVRAGSSEAGSWQEELGIWVPVGSVVLQVNYPSHPAVEPTRTFPEETPMWATSPILLPRNLFLGYDGAAVIDQQGFLSNLGVAVSRDGFTSAGEDGQSGEELQPFFFFWNRNQHYPRVSPIWGVEIVEGKRRLVGPDEESDPSRTLVMEARTIERRGLPSGMRLWGIEHEYYNNLIHYEGVAVARLAAGSERDFYQEIPKRTLVSGSAIRSFWGRGRGRQKWPLEMLLGRFEPHWVGNGRILDPKLTRFSGWHDQTGYVG